jgi:hypothetical protein
MGTSLSNDSYDIYRILHAGALDVGRCSTGRPWVPRDADGTRLLTLCLLGWGDYRGSCSDVDGRPHKTDQKANADNIGSLTFYYGLVHIWSIW